ncbi:MAG: cation:proton antiporter regulatory subunit, partial [Flavobacteriales bacterium]
LANQFFSTGLALVLAMLIFAVTAIVFRRKLQHFYGRVEQRFISNLNQREARKQRPELAPWDMHLAEIELRPDSVAVGRSLKELALRERFGVNVALIERGERTIPVPVRDERLLPGDNLLLIGTDEQLAAANKELDTVVVINGLPELEKEDIRLGHYRILPSSPLVGKTIRGSGIREKALALVTGIERNAQRLPNPESTLRFEANDLLWLVGNGTRIAEFMRDSACTRE